MFYSIAGVARNASRARHTKFLHDKNGNDKAKVKTTGCSYDIVTSCLSQFCKVRNNTMHFFCPGAILKVLISKQRQLICGMSRTRATKVAITPSISSQLNEKYIGCQKKSYSVQNVNSLPPLVVRSAIVGATTALLTPIFPIVALNYFAFRNLTRRERFILTGGSSMLCFSAMVLLPKAFFYAPLLLPFALGNASVAAVTYLGVDLLLGGPAKVASYKLGRIPVAGPSIGIITALTAPLIYPACFAIVYPEYCWDFAQQAGTYSMIIDWCYNSFTAPILVFSGGVAGIAIHSGLQPLILGVPGFEWQKLAGITLASVSLGTFLLYSSFVRDDARYLGDVDLDCDNFPNIS